MHSIFADERFAPSVEWKKMRIIESDFVTATWTNTSAENRKYVQRYHSRYVAITKNRRFFFKMQYDQCCPHIVVVVPLTCHTPALGSIETPSISGSKSERLAITDVEYGSIDNL